MFTNEHIALAHLQRIGNRGKMSQIFKDIFKCVQMFTDVYKWSHRIGRGSATKRQNVTKSKCHESVYKYFQMFTYFYKCFQMVTNFYIVLKSKQIILAYGNDGQHIGKMSQRANAMRMFTQNTMRVFTEPAICNFSCQCQNIYIFTNIYKKS